MAITEPTAFTNTKQSGTVKHFIVSLTDGSTTWLIGNFEAEFTDGHVYHLVDKYSIGQSADFFEDTWSRATVRLDISNVPYKQDADGWVRLSDEVGDIVAETAKIYVTSDPNATSLSECLVIFNGITRCVEGYNDQKIDIVLEDNGYITDTVLLTKTIKDVS